MTIENNKIISDIAIHPGETLLEILDDTKMTQRELAYRIGFAKETVNDIVRGRNPINPETAIKLERVFGISMTFWNNLQKNYDETIAFLNDKVTLEKESEIAKKYLCYNELADQQLVKKTRNWSERARELMQYFQVASLEAVQSVEPVAFRKTNNKSVSQECLAVWLRLGDIEAAEQKLSDFDRPKLVKLIPIFRKLTREKPEVFSRQLIKLCNSCGVAIVFTPYISRTYANGATRWLGDNPLIQLSLRYRYSDTFWFTFFHELVHILRHGKKDQHIEMQSAKSSDDIEKEADNIACEILIPQKDYKGFVSKGLINLNSATLFANKIGISPEIVAGRIAHETGNWASVASWRKRLTLVQNK